MHMRHRAHFRPARHDVAMEAPFAGRAPRALVAAVEMHDHHVRRRHLVIGHARWRNQEAFGNAHADIAGHALVEAAAVHALACGDDFGAQVWILHLVLRDYWAAPKRRSRGHSCGPFLVRRMPVKLRSALFSRQLSIFCIIAKACGA